MSDVNIYFSWMDQPDLDGFCSFRRSEARYFFGSPTIHSTTYDNHPDVVPREYIYDLLLLYLN